MQCICKQYLFFQLLQHRLGVKVQKIEVGSVDFLKDSAIIKVYYEEASDINSVNCLARMPKDC